MIVHDQVARCVNASVRVVPYFKRHQLIPALTVTPRRPAGWEHRALTRLNSILTDVQVSPGHIFPEDLQYPKPPVVSRAALVVFGKQFLVRSASGTHSPLRLYFQLHSFRHFWPLGPAEYRTPSDCDQMCESTDRHFYLLPLDRLLPH